MSISTSAGDLQSWASGCGLDIQALDSRHALDLMLDCYEHARASDANPVDEDGDGLLIQWGTYEFEDEPTFQFDVTRQFTTADADEPEEDAIWQLHLTVHYPVNAETEAPEGSLWLFNPADTSPGRSTIADAGVLELLDGMTPLRVVLELEQAD